MTHLILCREYPPAAYPPGGIGTYAGQIVRLLVAAGEHVHVIAHRWPGAPRRHDASAEGRLVIHRVALDDDPGHRQPGACGDGARIARALLASPWPVQAFSWQAALLAEHLVEEEGIDVIEAQDWEAPLAYFQLRRAAGLGPGRRPPCLVHVHSPTARIYAANNWVTSVADYEPATAFEALSIAAADAVLCPSRFVAEEAIETYQLDRARVWVVPYPLADVARVERSAATWADGPVCHVGRLEARKGVLEWAEAIAAVGGRRPSARFEFAGSDTPLAVTGGAGVRSEMVRRLPRPVRKQVRFHGSLSRQGVLGVLAQASAAVVPSRWDNFPYSCLEAMASGLPMLVSPHGGMREIVEDGVSGWVASDASPAGLGEALERLLATPGPRRRDMGAAAEAAVRTMCNGATVVAQHLAMRRQLIAAAAPEPTTADAMAAHWPIVTCAGGDDEALDRARDLVSRDAHVSGVGIVDSGATLVPGAVAVCASWLARDATLGLVAGWTASRGPGPALEVPPQPSRPYAMAHDRLAPFVVVRAEAVRQAARGSRLAAFDDIVTAGWRTAMYPAVLSSVARIPAASRRIHQHSAMTLAVQRLHTPILQWLCESSPLDRRRFLADTLFHPQRVGQWLLQRARDARLPWPRPRYAPADGPSRLGTPRPPGT